MQASSGNASIIVMILIYIVLTVGLIIGLRKILQKLNTYEDAQKKKILLGIGAAALAVVLTTSGTFIFLGGKKDTKKGRCDECGQIEPLRLFVEQDGDERWYCEDCYRMAKLFC